MEKEEIQALIDEKMQELTATFTESLNEFKTELTTAAAASSADLDEKVKALEALKDNLGGLEGITTKMTSLEELLGTFETALAERLEKVETFSKAFGEDFEYTKLEERIVAIEDMPFVKGMGPSVGKVKGLRDKMNEATTLQDKIRIAQGLVA